MNLLLKISDEGCNKYHRPNAKAYYKWDTCFSSLNEGKKIDFSMHYRQERIQVRTDAIYSIEPLRKFLYTVTFLTHKYWTIFAAFPLWIDGVIHVELLLKSEIQKYIYIGILQISAFSGTKLSEPSIRKNLNNQSKT